MSSPANNQLFHIAHVTSVHRRFDVRIFAKQCVSLAQAGYRVSLIVADGQGNQTAEGVAIYDVGQSRGRIHRVSQVRRKILKTAIDLGADLYQFHDPELMSIARPLLAKKRLVVFDAHEDLPAQILVKNYLKPYQRKWLSRFFRWYEGRVAGRLSGVITATDHIQDKFRKFNSRVVAIKNYPRVEHFNVIDSNCEKFREIAYIGGISRDRGLQEIVAALSKLTDVRLNLAGVYLDKEGAAEFNQAPGWAQVNDLGFLDRNQIVRLLQRSMIGMVTLHPTINFYDALPIKLFEYMSAGIPVIASNFPIIKAIVETHECGICVDPTSVPQIAEAIERLMENPQLAAEMGARGKQAVEETFNWDQEWPKLNQFYRSLLN
jgi:glycosyltransferase involved in cell wall biosynthesis